MTTPVTATPPAPPSEAAEHFARKLAFETDCSDVPRAIRSGAQDFVLLDVRGRPAYARAHVPGALSLPHRDITAERMMAWPHDMLFVVYCAGPHCNGADKAALEALRPGPAGEGDAGRHDRLGRRGLSPSRPARRWRPERHAMHVHNLVRRTWRGCRGTTAKARALGRGAS